VSLVSGVSLTVDRIISCTKKKTDCFCLWLIVAFDPNSMLLCDVMAGFYAEFDAADVVKRLKDELWERNRGHEMLKSWNGDLCSKSTWEGFTCQSKESILVVTKL
jgi:hypothetical protein